VPDLTLTFDDRVTQIQVSSSILTAGKLNICLLQLPSSVASIERDQSRPNAVAAIGDLLHGGPNHPVPALQQMAPGADPIVIVAPEFAFGSGDWDAIDEFVRRTARPIVLFAGFGATPGQTLLDWSTVNPDATQTMRHLAWEQQQSPISGPMRVNGAWCWIHEPGGSTHCVVYLKNVHEQSHEAVQFPDLQSGSTIVRLAFADADLCPLICADLLQPAAQDPHCAQSRVRQALATSAVDRPALVIGSLLQFGYNVNWETAVDSLLNQVLVGRPGAVALCNIAHDAPVADEDKDKWRSLSGVYGRFSDLPKGQDNLAVGRALNARGIAGAVVRRTEPCATTGVIGWAPFNPVTGKFVWHAKMSCLIVDTGLKSPIEVTRRPFECEMARFVRRHPPPERSAPRLAAGLAMVIQHIGGIQHPTASALLDSTLEGLSGRRHDPDNLHSAEISNSLRVGLHAIATLRSINGVDWQGSASLMGQLQIAARQRYLLVWRSSTKSPRAMVRDLAAWRLQPGEHPDLIVLGAGPFGDLSEAEIGDDRRDDISSAPSSDADLNVGGSLAPLDSDFTVSRSRRRVAALALSTVADIYCDYEAGSDEARTEALIAQIGAFFGQA
jgi:hypothetical protein